MTPSPSSQDRLKGQIGCTIHDYKNGVIDADVAVNAILELTRPTPDLGDVRTQIADLIANGPWDGGPSEEDALQCADRILIALRAALDKKD